MRFRAYEIMRRAYEIMRILNLYANILSYIIQFIFNKIEVSVKLKIHPK